MLALYNTLNRARSGVVGWFRGAGSWRVCQKGSTSFNKDSAYEYTLPRTYPAAKGSEECVKCRKEPGIRKVVEKILIM
jgi:hypothetical protein